MRKICLIALSLLCLMLLVSCKGSSDGLAIVFSENGVVSKEATTKEAGTVTMPVPAGTRARYCIGWYCENGEETIFLPIGASYAYAAGESKTFAPVYLSFTTSSTPTLDTTVTGGGIAFSTSIEKADWTALTRITENVTCGTLIARSEDIPNAASLSHQVLAEAQKNAVADIVSTEWQAENEKTLTFGTTLGDISDADLATPYTAIGYIKLTYSNQENVYIYALYSKEAAPSCALVSFPEVAKQRLNFSMLTSVSLDLAEKGGGITFASAIDRRDWTILSSIATSITRGTLIYPAQALSELGGPLTHASLEAAGKTAIDIPSTTWLSTTDQKLYFGATLTNLAPYQRNVAYTAVGYTKITYSDDTVTYVYAVSEESSAPAHSIFSLVHAAKNDLSDEMTEVYQYPVGDLFSPYTEAEHAILDELSEACVGVLFNKTSAPGRHILDPAYEGFFSSRVVRESDKDPESVEIWREIYHVLNNIYYEGGGALIITAKDGTPLNADNITKVILKNGTTEIPNFKGYIFYEGALIVPYMVFTPPI